MNTSETKGILPARFSFRSASALTLATFALGAILALSACSTKTRTVQVGDSEAQRAAEQRATAAEAAQRAAEERAKAAQDALAALEKAQEALTSATTDQQRMAARAAVVEAQADLVELREALEQLPSDAGTPDDTALADTALAAVDTALTRVAEALGTTDAALASGAGPLVLASMHTSLDRAQAALDDAQAALKTALAADPSDALRNLLTQARGTLTTAQVSLVPLLRQELADAETEAAAQRTRADTAESEAATQRTRADTEKARADAAEAQRDAEKARADTYDPRVSLATALVPRGERFVPLGETATITRTPRTGPEGHQKLDIRTAAVAYAAGKRVASEAGGLVVTDELPLRSVTLRSGGRHPIRVQGDDGTPTAYSNTDGELDSSLQIGADGVTLKFGGEGVVYYDMQRTFDYFNDTSGTPNHNSWWRYGPDGKLGDASAAAGGTITDSHARDLGLEEASGTLTADQATALVGYETDNDGACWQSDLSVCGDWAHDDITIAFGTPSQSPQGEASWYWKELAGFTDEQRNTGLPYNFGSGWNGRQGDADAAAGGTITDSHARDLGLEEASGTLTAQQATLLQAYARYNSDGRDAGELGNYELWLSNYGGVDDMDTADEADDTHRYLQYAAYGLFMFFDNVVNTPAYVRPQAFATGYDAFQNADGMKTTDITTSIGATFTGHTTARLLISDGNLTHAVIQRGTTPLRGDITLNACIGGTGCTAGGDIPSGANKISGMISDIEELRHDGAWVVFRDGHRIPMAEGDINADGSFGGALDYPVTVGYGDNSWEFNSGLPGENGATSSRYSGNFYGPRNGLEAAGWWWVESDRRLEANDVPSYLGIIGSFGAKCTSGCE